MAGHVLVDEQPVTKPGAQVRAEASIRIRGDNNPYVSRGGLKLRGALDVFAAEGLALAGRIVMDVGASTGGFTDCLLQAGVARVHAVDVGYGQLAWKLASDHRVVVHDRSNIRKMDPSQIEDTVDLIVVDCSFVALAKVVPHLPPFLSGPADVVALVKPQFELDPDRVGKGGIVRDESARADAMRRAREAATSCRFAIMGQTDSPVAGRAGNREVFLWLRYGAPVRVGASLRSRGVRGT